MAITFTRPTSLFIVSGASKISSHAGFTGAARCAVGTVPTHGVGIVGVAFVGVLVAVHETTHASIAHMNERFHAAFTAISHGVVVTFYALRESVWTAAVRVAIALAFYGAVEAHVTKVTRTIVRLNTDALKTALITEGHAGAVFTCVVSGRTFASEALDLVHTILRSGMTIVVTAAAFVFSRTFEVMPGGVGKRTCW